MWKNLAFILSNFEPSGGGGGGNRKGYLIASRRLEGGEGLLEKKAYFKRVSCPWRVGGGGGAVLVQK